MDLFRNSIGAPWFNFRRGSFVFNEGGRGLTLSIMLKHGVPFRLYFTGWVFMLCDGKWSVHNWRDRVRQIADGIRLTAKEVAVRQDTLTVADFNAMLDAIYQRGGSCDCAFVTLEFAFTHGLIGPWEFRWRRLLRSVGTWGRNVISGVQSVLRTLGTKRTEKL